MEPNIESAIITSIIILIEFLSIIYGIRVSRNFASTAINSTDLWVVFTNLKKCKETWLGIGIILITVNFSFCLLFRGFVWYSLYIIPSIIVCIGIYNDAKHLLLYKEVMNSKNISDTTKMRIMKSTVL